MSRMAAAVNQTNQVTKSNVSKTQRQRVADWDVAEVFSLDVNVFSFTDEKKQIELRNHGFVFISSAAAVLRGIKLKAEAYLC